MNIHIQIIMDLLHFAHRGEAQAFIKALKLKASSDSGDFYINDELCLLISGEGHTDTLSKLSFYLGKYKIKKIINFGIAGSLSKLVEVNKVYPIRTAYMYMDGGPVFQSFTSDNDTSPKSSIDCITSSKRVLDDEMAKKLAPFAQIVDRELWSLGKASHLFKVPYYSYKLISDVAGANTDCFDLKLKALEFSELLYEYYLTLESSHDLSGPKKDFTLPFHASFTQRKSIEKLFSKIPNKDTIEQFITDTNINSSNELIEELENTINPINKHIKMKVSKIISPLESIGAKIIYDKNMDQKKIKLQMEINSQTNIDNLKLKLETLQFSDFENIWNGEIDV